MVAYNFQPRFAALVESGKKTQTIRRASRKRHAQPDEPVQLYTGQRTPQCRKLIDPDPTCVRVRPIAIYYPNRVLVENIPLSEFELHQLAIADGFVDSAEFLSFFVQRDPVFVGSIIEWQIK